VFSWQKTVIFWLFKGRESPIVYEQFAGSRSQVLSVPSRPERDSNTVSEGNPVFLSAIDGKISCSRGHGRSA
jgi:hypothetical protein